MISSSECDGFAYDPAKVEDRVQFLARTFTTKTLAVGNFTGLDGLHVAELEIVAEPPVGCRGIGRRGHGLLPIAIQESSRRSVTDDG